MKVQILTDHLYTTNISLLIIVHTHMDKK